MSFHDTSPAGFPHLSRGPVEQVNESLQMGNAGGKLRPSYRGHASRNELRWRQTSAANLQIKTLLCRVSAVVYPVFCSVTASGPLRRPAALGLLLRILRPFGVSVPPETSLRTTAKSAVHTSFGLLPEDRPLALGSRAHSLSSAQCDTSNNGRIQQTETLSCTRTK
jgi:hypothetical protein